MNGRRLAAAVFLASFIGPLAPGVLAQIVPTTPNRSKAEVQADNAKADREDGEGDASIAPSCRATAR